MLKEVVREEYKRDFPVDKNFNLGKNFRNHAELLKDSLEKYASFAEVSSYQDVGYYIGDILSIGAKIIAREIYQQKEYSSLVVYFDYVEGSDENDLNIIRNVFKEYGLEGSGLEKLSSRLEKGLVNEEKLSETSSAEVFIGSNL